MFVGKSTCKMDADGRCGGKTYMAEMPLFVCICFEYRRWYLPLSYMPHREALYAVVSVYWHDGPTTASEDSNMLRLWQTGVIVNATS